MPNAPPAPYRIAQYYQWHKEGKLVLAAPFQRKPVWSMRNKTFLIDTILHDLPMPEVFIQVKTDKEGKIKYIVIDGQQRIRAVLEFLDGEYSLLEEDTSPEYADKEFKELSDGNKADFWNYSIVTRELQTNSEEEVKTVFRRLNKYVVPLNRQELRNATYGGHFANMVNTIAENDDFWAENKIMTPTDIKRMIDAEYISELFIGMKIGIQQKDQEAIDAFYKSYDQQFPERENVRKDFEAIERMVKEILGDALVRTRWHGKADFYSFFLALCDLSKEYYFPQDRYDKMKACLIEFAFEVDKQTKKSEKDRNGKNTTVADYVENVEKQTTHKSTREKRYRIVRGLLIPFLIAKDPRRAFNEEERRIAWNKSTDKKCTVCGQTVEWENYQLDHKTPHTKAGKTELQNSQITHKACNIKKSDKTS